LRAAFGARIFGAVEAAEQRERVKKYEAEIERLKAQLVDLDARQQRIPRLGAFAVLALPAWYLWGFAWAVVTLVLTVALVLTAAYLLRTRHEDNERDIADIERDLKLLRED
jgi:Flp pilus assembly protein TadB